MKSLKSGLIVLGTVGLLFLGACSNATQENNSASNTESSTATNTSKTETAKSHGKSEHGDKEHGHGGQVVESGQYHLELVTHKEDKGSHLDFIIEKGEKHEIVSNAKVTAQVQLPDGTQKTLDFKYDAKDKHYTAALPGNAPGQYPVKVTADIGGEKVNGRFTVKQ
ncbi:hypothetical protein DP113_27315 [Brasilonema octagenarum UFV-E1]|uniref:YtkA-like domain-containing protein n=1 Tax=Brasilonema sennae CENA114 TaxID=415709 RepID=A0A856MKA6_9CYAN|nr:hypothetical protein [Brasilonema sennae]QDL11118.1 hypothetical protein DP114_27385 [Brasilonema sennae CENA114]QDL17464.1 hypothetical protein DP113_27315 [Brasilonema octagenarum UFV-E1]